MENTLIHLIDSLESALRILKSNNKADILAALHDHSRLPDKKLYGLASKTVDLLHETEQLLEPGTLVLADHFLGYMSAKCLTTVVELNIPDILSKGPKSISDLANISNAHQDRLERVLRILYNNGIFAYDGSTDTYSNNQTSEMLRSDHWTQWRNWVDLYGNEFYDMSRGIPSSCKIEATRCPAQIEYNTDKSMFVYFTEQGWIPRLHKTLDGGAVAQALGMVEDYPWEEVEGETILDIGGGGGGLIASILRVYKNLNGAILDVPKVIEEARTNFHSNEGTFKDVKTQVPDENLIVGDFTKEIPSYQVYTFKWCLHNWSDVETIKILKLIRKSIVIGPKSRLVIFESVLEDGRMGRLSRYASLNMMVAVGGGERTEAQWRSLAATAGWKTRRIFHLRNAWPCAIELVPTSNAELKSIGEQDMPSTDKVDGVSLTNGHHSEAQKISSSLRFLEPWNKSRGNPFIRVEPSKGYEYMNFAWVERPVLIHDVRSVRDSFNLDIHGFCFRDDPKGATPRLIEALRQNDTGIVQQMYYPEIDRLVKEGTGASRVIIFDHTMRKRRPELGIYDNPTGKEQPATMVHCDQSAKGAIRRLEQNLAPNESLKEILEKRVKLINVWRPLNGPVVDWPLAFMDYRTLNQSDNMYLCDLLRHTDEFRGQTVNFTYADDQKWYYLKEHRPDEVTMLKIWDNSESVEAKLCPHSAFKHPHTPLNADPRESIEVRCFAIWD